MVAVFEQWEHEKRRRRLMLMNQATSLMPSASEALSSIIGTLLDDFQIIISRGIIYYIFIHGFEVSIKYLYLSLSPPALLSEILFGNICRPRGRLIE